MTAIRVLIGDIYPLLRQGLRALLADEDDLRVIGEAENHACLLRLCEAQQPQVLVLGDLPPTDAPDLTVGVLHDVCPSGQTVMLATDGDPTRLRTLLAWGAAGIVLKGEPPELLLEAIRAVAAGGAWLSPTVREALATVAEGEAPSTAPPTLTEREGDVLQLIVAGRGNAAIASELALKEQTVRNYATRLYTKLGVGSRAEAMVWAREHGFPG